MGGSRAHLERAKRNSLAPTNLCTQAWNDDGIRILTISLVGWDSELPLLALDHAKKAFVPPLNDLTHSEGESERILATGSRTGVELSTCGEQCSGLGVGESGQPTLRYRWANKKGRT